MNKLRCLILSITFTYLISCQQKNQESISKVEKATIEQKEEPNKILEVPREVVQGPTEACLISNESQKLKKELFPFDFKNFNTGKLKRHFSKNTTIDSTYHSSDGFSYMIYKFKDRSAFISFFVKPQSKEESWFYLDYSSIDNNFFIFKNGVRIGEQRSDIYKILEPPLTSCDTLHIEEGDLPVYYDFIFKEDKLAKINITPSE